MKKTNTITVNQMIYDTLKTKKSKTPKYYDVLTKMGYKLYNGDDGWSAYDYWEIFTVDGDYLNISKTRGGKRALFKSFHNCNSADLTKVDYERIINLSRKQQRQDFLAIRFPCHSKNLQMYWKLKEDVRNYASLTETYARKVKKAEEEYEDAKKSLENWEKRLDESIIKFNDFKLKEIHDRRNKHK